MNRAGALVLLSGSAVITPVDDFHTLSNTADYIPTITILNDGIDDDEIVKRIRNVRSGAGEW